MPGELSFGSYVTTENGKKVVKELTYGNPAPEGVTAMIASASCRVPSKRGILVPPGAIMSRMVLF